MISLLRLSIEDARLEGREDERLIALEDAILPGSVGNDPVLRLIFSKISIEFPFEFFSRALAICASIDSMDSRLPKGA